VKLNNQPRELNKGFSLASLKPKIAKAQQETLKAHLQHKKKCASLTLNKKNQLR
jgi:hypothetical protein